MEVFKIEEEKIQVTGIITRKDEFAREILEVHQTRLDSINERTKKQTWEIRKLEKKVKELEKNIHSTSYNKIDSKGGNNNNDRK